ncbi:mitochondrial genome maintenance MGM101 [Choiromyces venosus 120613-1]|uniref:Mitochondrial genome maintenance protein MGM101 n=1 Tax=Choiromyces venosus 120613-1 TaxID=1336337 RepID=A0A3N4JGQ3_9PEZI|nr:mitochondrial genome maintenance MGM101 [Choiromyces venosus 120613-1]
MLPLSRRVLGKRLALNSSARLISPPAPSVLAVRYQSFDAKSGSLANKAQDTSISKSGFNDAPEILLDEGSGEKVDWARSFHGLSTEAFPKEVADILLAPVDPEDIEVKPDGILYLPEIKYRRILNKAFGPGGWGLAPRGETIVTEKTVTREYALVCHGRLVSVARGEQDYFDPSGIPTATEGCKSNALMRTCKDLGIVSELWDPRYIRVYKKKYCEEKFVEHVVSKKKAKRWIKKGDPIEYPFRVTSFG